MQICTRCGELFPKAVLVDGKRLDVHGRLYCLTCKPHRPLRGPRKKVFRPTLTKSCEHCGVEFLAKLLIEGKTRSLYRRRFCLACSPFGSHNTAKVPLGTLSSAELLEVRRQRRNAKTYRYQKEQRKSRKAELIEARGGRCEECGYAQAPTALEFHHRSAGTKEFQISSGNVSRARSWAEAAKCDLLCANCHRRRHLAAEARRDDRAFRSRRDTKRRAVALLGGRCAGCGAVVPEPLFEFHHRDPRTKDFAVSHDGIIRPWPKIEAELAKCVLLCANCHRETHAGLRSADRGWSLSEAAGAYRVRIRRIA